MKSKEIWSTCYKLVVFHDGRPHSVLHDAISLSYSLKEVNYPKVGKLFVFKKMPNMEQINRIIAWTDWYRIYRCQGLNLEQALESCFIACSFQEFWASGRGGITPVLGTYFVDAVKFTKNVTQEFKRLNNLS